MSISITQKLIDEGVRKDCNACPTAKAIEDATGLPARVTSATIHWGDVGGCFEGSAYKYRMDTPPAVREFLDRYDEGLPVEPISFELKAA
ncbi:hypothetical protein LCGC14_0734600 [marine sediment metagenome]|uniref:Uncharacterized protein n=1 Tax=marine sediment metagenome TaxID=412755 RepID=A0A0F9TFU6_9ZZZZ